MGLQPAPRHPNAGEPESRIRALPTTNNPVQVLHAKQLPLRLVSSSLPADLSLPWHSRVAHVLLNSTWRNHVHTFREHPTARKERTNVVAVAPNFVDTLWL